MYLVNCPHPECEYIAEIITNHHCISVHHITKAELQLEFGRPQRVCVDIVKLKNNLNEADARITATMSVPNLSFYTNKPHIEYSRRNFYK